MKWEKRKQWRKIWQVRRHQARGKLRYSGLVYKKGVNTTLEQKGRPAKTGCNHRRLENKQPGNNGLSGKSPG